MTDIHMQQEKQAQFERDEAAYKTLNPREQRNAERMAKVGFFLRSNFVYLGRGLLVATEVGAAFIAKCFQFVFGDVYTKLAKFVANGVKIAAKTLEDASKWCVHQIAEGCIKLFGQGGKEGWREKVRAWEKEALQAVDKFWRGAEKYARVAAKAVVNFGQNGMLFFYNVTKWTLNPRTRSGEPLLGSERANKWAGIAVAGALLTGLVMGLPAAFVAVKVFAVETTHAILTSSAPALVKGAELMLFHPVLYGGTKVAEFMILPIVAATRQVLKSSQFTQGVAYQYNLKLRESDKQPTPRMKLAFVENTFSHLVGFAMPEYYEAQLRRKREAKAQPAAVVTADTTGTLNTLAANDDFNKTAQPSASVDPAKPAPTLKPPRL